MRATQALHAQRLRVFFACVKERTQFVAFVAGLPGGRSGHRRGPWVEGGSQT